MDEPNEVIKRTQWLEANNLQETCNIIAVFEIYQIKNSNRARSKNYLEFFDKIIKDLLTSYGN